MNENPQPPINADHVMALMCEELGVGTMTDTERVDITERVADMNAGLDPDSVRESRGDTFEDAMTLQRIQVPREIEQVFLRRHQLSGSCATAYDLLKFQDSIGDSPENRQSV